LRAEADAEERPLFPQGHRDPFDLAADVVIGVIGAHRPAENDGAGMLVERFGQRIAEPGPADVERISQRAQHVTDPAGGGAFLVEDDQNRPQSLSAGG
jgi:hypothetical protein